jgi:hypothetical protein
MFASIAQAARPAMQSSGRFLAPAVAAGTQAAVAVIVVYAEIAIIAAAGYGSYTPTLRNSGKTPLPTGLEAILLRP